MSNEQMTFICLCCLAVVLAVLKVILNKWWRKMRSEEPAKHDGSFLLKLQQKFEDDKMDRSIEIESIERYIAWTEGKMYIRNPLREGYVISHFPTARFINSNINELITEKFNKLKENHGSNI